MTSSSRNRLWKCPKCGERFVTANLWHSCGKYRLKDLFAKSEPHVFRVYKKFETMVRAYGPIHVIPQKTRVVFQVRVRFGGGVPRKTFLQCALALPRRLEHSRFFRIESYAPRFHGHYFRAYSEDDLDEFIEKLIPEAYAVGAQAADEKINRTGRKEPGRRPTDAS